jgi:hypothetical protein
VLSDDKSAVAFLSDDDAKNGIVDIAFARLASGENSAGIDADGRLAVFEFERTNRRGMDLILEEADFRSADNAGISVADLPEVSIDGLDIPARYELVQNYPNPFNATTQIEFRLPQQSQMQLVILNVLGQPVRTLINRSMDAGTHRIVWNGRNETGQEVVSGIYIVHMKAGSFRETKEMLFLK